MSEAFQPFPAGDASHMSRLFVYKTKRWPLSQRSATYSCISVAHFRGERRS